MDKNTGKINIEKDVNIHLENKKVKVLKISNKQVAVSTIKKNIETFEEKFGKRTAKV